MTSRQSDLGVTQGLHRNGALCLHSHAAVALAWPGAAVAAWPAMTHEATLHNLSVNTHSEQQSTSQCASLSQAHQLMKKAYTKGT